VHTVAPVLFRHTLQYRRFRYGEASRAERINSKQPTHGGLVSSQGWVGVWACFQPPLTFHFLTSSYIKTDRV